MKDEINSDIASFVTDQEYSDYDETDSRSWTEEEFTEENDDEEYEDEEFEDEDEEYEDEDTNNSAEKQITSEESDDESVFYDNDNTDEIEHHTSIGVRRSQSLDSERFVEAEENVDAEQDTSIVVDDMFSEAFEAILPPTEFIDEIVDNDVVIGYDETEPSDTILEQIDHIQEEEIDISPNEIENNSEEPNQTVESRPNSIESQYEDTESEDSQDNSDEESEELVTDSEFENIKRNSVDLQENALFIQQQLNKATNIVLAKSSTELRDDVSPASSHKSEDATEGIYGANENVHASEDVVIVLENDDSNIISGTDILLLEAITEPTDSTDSANISAQVEVVVANQKVDDLSEMVFVESVETSTINDSIQNVALDSNNVNEVGTSTSSKMISSTSNEGASTSTSIVSAAEDIEEVLHSSELPTSSKQAQQPQKQVKSTTKAPKKIPVRKASLALSGPFGSVRTNNVRAMQQELLNKSIPKPFPSKPSKIVPPKVYTKASITSLTERITKFIKPFANASTSKDPSTSTASTVVKNVIPKKKYHETCFSDDNPTSDEEEEQTTPVRRQVPIRQQSMPNIMERQLADEEETPERQARRILAEGKVANFVEAQLAVALIDLKFNAEHAIWAAKECSSIGQAIALLQQECELCTGIYPMNQIVTMLKCTHSCCQECAKNYFTIQVSEIELKFSGNEDEQFCLYK